jgi:hypothetical protein
MKSTKRVYIAGPMRGYPNFNFPAFDAAAKRGRDLGYVVISPAELDRATGFSEQGQDGKVNDRGHNETVTLDFMKGAAWRDFKAIVGDRPDQFRPTNEGCDAVAMLPGWERSRGARAEKAIAEWVGLDILDAETFLPLGGEKSSPIEAVASLAGTLAPLAYGDGFVMKDSGARQTFETGAVRDAGSGKGFWHCLPYVALEALAKLYEAGAKKYAKHNWKKGIPLSRYIDSAYRHLAKLAEGWPDEDHAAAVLWNVAGYLWTRKEISEGRLPATLSDL